MGTTRFKLFSSTGPSVAMGLVIAPGGHAQPDAGLVGALGANSSQGVRRTGGGFACILGAAGAAAMARPLRSWAFTILAMLPLAILGIDPFHPGPDDRAAGETRRSEDFRLVASKFEPGMMAPLTVVLESTADFRKLGEAGAD